MHFSQFPFSTVQTIILCSFTTSLFPLQIASHLFYYTSLTTATTDPDVHYTDCSHSTCRISLPFPLPTPYHIICPGARLSVLYSPRFYGEVLLARRPTPNLEDHPLTAIRYCLFNISSAFVHVCICVYI